MNESRQGIFDCWVAHYDRTVAETSALFPFHGRETVLATVVAVDKSDNCRRDSLSGGGGQPLCRCGARDDSPPARNFYSAVESGMMMDEAWDADDVVDLHNGSREAKQELLCGLAQAVPAEALVLTSVLPTSANQAAAWMAHPGRVVGFGLLPPIEPQGPVELARAIQTRDQSARRAKTFWHDLGYEPVWVAAGPGLVLANRLGQKSGRGFYRYGEGRQK